MLRRSAGRRQSGIAPVLWVATVLGAIGVVLGAARLAGPAFGDSSVLVLASGLLGFDAIVYATMGAVLVSRQPANLVGWILLVTGPLMIVTFGGFAFGAILYERNGPNDLAAGLAAWVGGLTIGPTILLAGPLLCLMFPDGGLPGPRWRYPAIAVLAALAGEMVLHAFQPGPVNTGLANNPLGIESPVVRSLGPIAALLLATAVLGGASLAIVAVATRFRRSGNREREQLKWLLAASAVLILGMSLALADGAADFTVLDAGYVLALSLIPIAVGIAVLRYRLYDIDRIISRTLAYAAVTAVLATVFAVVVLSLQAILAAFTQRNTLAVAISTLVVAALFQPIRGRVQRVVDRRFNRSRYDAEHTVDAYAKRLRNEVDLATVRATLVETVDGAVHPLTSAVWLRQGPRNR